MALRLTVTDLVSPSYFVATAAVELGFFADEALDVEFVQVAADLGPKALKAGDVTFFGGSPYVAFLGFPEWRGGKLLCALSQGAYWTLAVRSDLNAERGDLNAVKGLRILAGGGPGIALKRLLIENGIDLERDGVTLVTAPWPPEAGGNMARQGARGIEEGIADAFWGNGMRAEYAARKGVAKVLLDVRRDGPPAAQGYTFPALCSTAQFVADHPDQAAAATRAVVKTQRALKQDPELAARAAARLFPAEEAALISGLIARDAPYYDASISTEAVDRTAAFARAAGLISEPVAYSDLVATDMRPIWSA